MTTETLLNDIPVDVARAAYSGISVPGRGDPLDTMRCVRPGGPLPGHPEARKPADGQSGCQLPGTATGQPDAWAWERILKDLLVDSAAAAEQAQNQ